MLSPQSRNIHVFSWVWELNGHPTSLREHLVKVWWIENCSYEPWNPFKKESYFKRKITHYKNLLSVLQSSGLSFLVFN